MLRKLAPADLRGWQPTDLHSARLAARIFDQASRGHMERSETLQLRPSNVGGVWPNWTRFPRLRRLVMFYDWKHKDLTSVWEALPCSRLTTLNWRDHIGVPRRVWESACCRDVQYGPPEL